MPIVQWTRVGAVIKEGATATDDSSIKNCQIKDSDELLCSDTVHRLPGASIPDDLLVFSHVAYSLYPVEFTVY